MDFGTTIRNKFGKMTYLKSVIVDLYSIRVSQSAVKREIKKVVVKHTVWWKMGYCQWRAS